MAGKKKKIRISILLVLAAMLIIGISVAMRNPRVKLLYSVINFSESTLKNEEYLLYDVDIMEVFSDYANSDTRITGVMGFPEIKGMNATISVDMDAERSFSQKKFASESSLNILWAEAGQLNLYAQDKTWYISAPILGADIGYAFPTDVDWFPKMPELTSDIDRAWFRENYSNIVKLMSQIEIEKTDKTIENDDGTESTGYSVTIHKGDGHFIWELLGMDDPDYDVNVIMYLTNHNKFRRMEVDLSDILEGATLTIDGENASTCIFTYELPDNESMDFTMTRNRETENWIDITSNYYGNNGKIYQMTAGLNWEEIKNGFKMNLKNIKFTCDDELLARAYFLGKVVKEEAADDLFKDKTDYLNSLEVIQWKTVRDDTESFIQDVLDKLSLPDLSFLNK